MPAAALPCREWTLAETEDVGPSIDGHAAGEGGRPVASNNGAATRLRRLIPRHHAILAGLAVVAVAAGLRWYRSGALSLWLDEGLTIHFTRLPWQVVVGLEGVYVENPPLYYALTKLASEAMGELFAGRLLSVLAGTATVGVVYVLGSRLLDWRAGLAAAAILAISPLHIWYSQEARQYATAGFGVAVAYLALVAGSQTGRTAWAVAYGVALWIAMFTDYSALYALAVHPLLLLIVAVRSLRRAIPLVVAAVVAAGAYVPWMIQIVPTFADLVNREGYLGVTPDRLGASLLSIVGLDGSGSYFYTIEPAMTAWRRWPELHVLLLAALVPAAFIGLVALARRSGTAVAVGAGLLAGTVLVAVGITLVVTPGFAERTILYATFGWAIVCGSAVLVVSLRNRARAAVTLVAVLSVGAVLGVSLVTLRSMYATGDKQHWRELAGDVARVTPLGLPVITYPGVAATFVEVYRPGSLSQAALHIEGNEPLLGGVGSGGSGFDAAWYAYGAYSGHEARRQELEAAGYSLVMHRYYWDPLYLDLYVTPGATLGTPIDVNGAFAGTGSDVRGWTLPPVGIRFERDAGFGRGVSLESDGAGEPRMVRAMPAAANLYQLEFEVRSVLTSGAARAFLICASADGASTYVYPDGGGVLDVPADGEWHSTTLVGLCSEGTDHVLIDLRNAGTGTASYRRVELRELEVQSG
jgi:4-amino-4-deoxy-L-arabinose transferase-like glycosyltransferase